APLLSSGRSMTTTPDSHLPIATPLSLSDRGGNRRMSHVSLRRASVDAPQPVARAPQDLGGHPDDELAEVAPLQHSDESARRVFETVDDVLAVANGSADVLEVDVDAVWTCRGQSRRKIGGAMIDRGVEAKLVLHEGAFLGTASNADRPRPGELRELADERPDRPARRGDDNGFVGLWLADRAQ